MTPASVPPVYVLVHARITPSTTEIRVKSADATLTASMLGALGARLSGR